jgi:hypothetical protein
MSPDFRHQIRAGFAVFMEKAAGIRRELQFESRNASIRMM